MSSLLDRLSGFDGTGPQGLAFQWLGRRPTPLPGTPIGVTQDSTGSLVGLDLTLMKEMIADLEVKDVGIIGEQGFGKTFLMMLLLYYWTIVDVGEGSARIKIDSYKRNNRQRAETAPLVEDLCGCKIISPFSMRLNPLSRRFKMTMEEKFTLIGRLIRFKTGRDRLGLEEETVLQEALRIVESDTEKDPSFPAIRMALQHYVPSDVADVTDRTEQDAVGESYRDKLLLSHTTSKHMKLLDAAFQMELAVGLLNQGEFASLLSGEYSGDETFALLTQRVVSIDYHGVDESFRSVIEIVLGAIDEAASTPYPGHDLREGPRIPELQAHVVATDEAYRPWENKEFADSDYKSRKTRRASGMTGVMAFHRLRDFFEAIGNEATGKKARNALSEIKVWFIGRQTRDSLPDIRSFFDLSETVVESLTTLRKGEFWLLVPGSSGPIPVIIIGTQKLVDVFNTEGAHHSLLQRYFETGDMKSYITYLEKTTPTDDENADGGGSNYEDKVLV